MDFWALKVPCGGRTTVKVEKGEEVYFTQALIDCQDEMVALIVHQKNLNDCVVGAFLSNIPQLVYSPEILFREDFQISHTGSNGTVTVCGYRVAPSKNPSYRSTSPAVGTTMGTRKDWGLTKEDGVHKNISLHYAYTVPYGCPYTFKVKEGEEVHVIGARVENMKGCKDEMVALLIHQENLNDRVAGAFLRHIPRQVYYPPFVFYEDFQISHTGSNCDGYRVQFTAETFEYTSVSTEEDELPDGEGSSSQTFPHKKPKIDG